MIINIKSTLEWWTQWQYLKERSFLHLLRSIDSVIMVMWKFLSCTFHLYFESSYNPSKRIQTDINIKWCLTRLIFDAHHIHILISNVLSTLISDNASHKKIFNLYWRSCETHPWHCCSDEKHHGPFHLSPNLYRMVQSRTDLN